MEILYSRRLKFLGCCFAYFLLLASCTAHPYYGFSISLSIFKKLSFLGTFNAIFLAIGIYFLVVYFYLRRLTKKYLNPIDRTNELSLITKQIQTNLDLREKFKDKEEINVLVLTGGGVRGMIPLLVLEELEKLTEAKAGELFQLMAGTSAGAISCALLSIPGMVHEFEYSAQDILRDYVANSRRMFSAPLYHKFLTLFGMLGPRYLPEGKLEVMRRYFGNLTLADIVTNLIIPVYDIVDNSLKIIRNWSLPLSKDHPNYLLRDVVHGASNPPMLFSPRAFLLAGNKEIFIDPGGILNNPVSVAFMNVLFLFPWKKLRFVLIGNGGTDAEAYSYQNIAEFGAYGLFQYLLNSPVVSTKFSVDLVNEYIDEAKEYGMDIELININSTGGNQLATSDTSDANMEKIRNFGEKMIAENREAIDKLATLLKG